MAITTPSMGLRRWDQPNDIFSYIELSNNFNLIDLHDHSSGKGVQIPAEGIANLAIDSTKLADNSITTAKLNNAVVTDAKLSNPNNGVYRVLQAGGASFGTQAASTWIIREGSVISQSGQVSGTPPVALYIVSSNMSVAGKSAVLSLAVQHLTNNVAPAVNFTYGLYPVTIGTGTNAGVLITLGTVVTGSTVAINTPAINSLAQATSTDFALPADGYYALGFTNSGAPTVNHLSLATMQLRLRHV
jgi:hypothetical protein